MPSGLAAHRGARQRARGRAVRARRVGAGGRSVPTCGPREANARRADHGVRVLVFLVLPRKATSALLWLRRGTTPGSRSASRATLAALRTLRDPSAPLVAGRGAVAGGGLPSGGVLLLPSFVLLAAFAVARQEYNDAALSVAALAVFALAAARGGSRACTRATTSHKAHPVTHTASTGQVERTSLLSLAHLSGSERAGLDRAARVVPVRAGGVRLRARAAWSVADPELPAAARAHVLRRQLRTARPASRLRARLGSVRAGGARIHRRRTVALAITYRAA